MSTRKQIQTKKKAAKKNTRSRQKAKHLLHVKNCFFCKRRMPHQKGINVKVSEALNKLVGKVLPNAK